MALDLKVRIEYGELIQPFLLRKKNLAKKD
jgi:hypothetical protein